MLGLLLLLLFFLGLAGASPLVTIGREGIFASCPLRCRFKPLAERVVSVNDNLLALCLVSLLWLENDHFSLNLGVRVGTQEVFSRHLVNKYLFHHRYKTTGWQFKFEALSGFVHRHGLVFALVEVGAFGASLAHSFLDLNAVTIASEL